MLRPRLIAGLFMCILLIVGPSAVAGHHDDDASASECHGQGHHQKPHPNGKERACDREAPEEDQQNEEQSASESQENGQGNGPEEDPAEQGHPQGGPPGHERRKAKSAQPSDPNGSPSSSPGGPVQSPTGLTLELKVDRVVAELGATLNYTITITNPSSQPVSTTVRAEIPDEIDFVSSSAGSPTGGAISWAIAGVQPGTVQSLAWSGKVARLGDLEVLSLATLGEGDVAVTDRAQTFLSSVKGLVVERSQTTPDWGTHVERKVVRRRVSTFDSDPSAAVGGAVLPQTGAPVRELVVVGVLIVLGGLLLASRNKRHAAVALMIVMIAAACTNEPEPRSLTPREPTPAETEKGDEVLGTQFEKEKSDNAGADDATGDGEDTETGDSTDAADDDDAEVADAADDVAPEDAFVEEVVTVEVPNQPPDPEALPSTPGANTMGLEWDEPSRTVLSATSSRLFTPDAAAEVLATLSDSGDAISSRVTLMNLTDDRRLHVRGHLVLEVTGDGGVNVQLESAPIDVVLDPRDEVSADFEFALPSGTFAITSAFVAS